MKTYRLLAIIATISCAFGLEALSEDLPDFPYYEIDLDKPAQERFL